ncbi:N-formylmethionyl-tRNA deformylase [Zymobacter palmae]|uniref:N-formylmethionyl-tRNA deformylase n=1 Tax=Zymobacter palmae TaxID=33074 RepID=A0A348HI26_9GAMM|nr:N-formylmethionyl-tRNA deformylase [Zymobacter palmae]
MAARASQCACGPDEHARELGCIDINDIFFEERAKLIKAVHDVDIGQFIQIAVIGFQHQQQITRLLFCQRVQSRQHLAQHHGIALMGKLEEQAIAGRAVFIFCFRDFPQQNRLQTHNTALVGAFVIAFMQYGKISMHIMQLSQLV